LITLI